MRKRYILRIDGAETGGPIQFTVASSGRESPSGRTDRRVPRWNGRARWQAGVLQAQTIDLRPYDIGSRVMDRVGLRTKAGTHGTTHAVRRAPGPTSHVLVGTAGLLSI